MTQRPVSFAAQEPTTPSDSPQAREWPESVRPGASVFGSTAFGNTLLENSVAGQPAGSFTTAVFDVCHVGVVLRAVLFVNAVIAVAGLFVSSSASGWFTLAAMGAAVALPAVLMWLLAACGLKHWLSRSPLALQWLLLTGLGAGCAAFGWSLGVMTGLDAFDARRWGAAAMAGATIAAVMFQWLRMRAQARFPAETTAKLAELQSRIRPHFLFNTLNTALSLVRLDPVRAEGVLEDLAELFRVALADNREAVKLSDEVALAQRYLAIEQVRFGDRLKVSWELDPDAGEARVPPLLLQPLVENAVRHGVEPADEGGMIRVRTRVKLGRAVVSIANTVPSAPSQPGNGMALRNVRERLRLMHDVAAQFDTRQEGNVFRVQVVVPL